MKISCVTYSYIGESNGYSGHMDWDTAGQAAIDAPILEGLDSMLKRLAPAKLDGLELWFNHAWPAKLTPILAGEIRKRLAADGLTVCACAGSIGNPRKDLFGSEARFQTANLLHAPMIAGHLAPEAISEIGKLAADYGVRVAYENYVEKNSAQILEVIQGCNEWVGIAFDTGSLAEQGGDPVQAIRELGAQIKHVHLRDVPSAGSLESVPVGTGLVDLPAVIRELKRIGYRGWLSIENPTVDHDPTEDILSTVETIRGLVE